ncbi:hypothetical protein PHMEG_0003380 [Phytophthora megakarya]|uniref:Bzip transcription factor n=1 Tax=Phytophthora megakarya TaxID=4795 RepID=A0A225WWI1_9STRA|nr:hypothetical protein PHMEG_0003380 [Phytophthora megakarya]
MFVEAKLDSVFPHVKGTQVGRKLLGQQLIFPCSMFFEWDEDHDYLVRLELVVDVGSPISRALFSIIDSAFVLEHSSLSQ